MEKDVEEANKVAANVQVIKDDCQKVCKGLSGTNCVRVQNIYSTKPIPQEDTQQLQITLQTYEHYTSIIRAFPASWLLILLNVLDALLVVSRECPIVLILNITDACHTLRPERRGFVVVSLSTNLAV